MGTGEGKGMDRRGFLKLAGLGTLGVAALPAGWKLVRPGEACLAQVDARGMDRRMARDINRERDICDQQSRLVERNQEAGRRRSRHNRDAEIAQVAELAAR